MPPARLLPGAWDGDSNVRADGTAHGFLVALVRPRCWSSWELPVLHRWELEEDPDPTGAGEIPEDDCIPRAVLGSRLLGLMSGDTREAREGRPQGLANLPPPRGLTIEDGNLFTDKRNLVALSKTRAFKQDPGSRM